MCHHKHYHHIIHHTQTHRHVGDIEQHELFAVYRFERPDLNVLSEDEPLHGHNLGDAMRPVALRSYSVTEHCYGAQLWRTVEEM